MGSGMGSGVGLGMGAGMGAGMEVAGKEPADPRACDGLAGEPGEGIVMVNGEFCCPAGLGAGLAALVVGRESRAL